MRRAEILKLFQCVACISCFSQLTASQDMPSEYEIAQEAISVEEKNESTDLYRQNLSVEPFLNEQNDVSEAVEYAIDSLTSVSDINIEQRNPNIAVEDELSYPYEENLLIKPLPKNYLLTSFTFKTKSNEFLPGKLSTDFDDYSHYTVFPKEFKPLLDKSATRQLHLRFTRGFWDAESWGMLPHNGFESGGSGVEIWAVIEADSKNSAFSQWKTLVNSLGGLFCASMNFIDGTKTTFPVDSFHPMDENGLPLFDPSKQLYLVRAALANEPICTENLTPFVKLFPTKGKSGITTLLDGHKVFDSSWHSLAIDISTNCDDSTSYCTHSLEAFVDVVMNVPNTLSRSENPIPKPLTSDKLRCDMSRPFDSFQCFQLPDETEGSYSLSQLFGKWIQGSSLISKSSSHVCVDIADSWHAFIQLNDSFFATTDNCFDLKDFLKQDIYFESNDTNSVVEIEEVPIYVSRSLTGYGQDRGGLRTVFSNPTENPVTLIYFESLPWFIRIYLSSMHLEDNVQIPSNLTLNNLLKSRHYIPAADRISPTHLEYTITIPSNTTIAVSYQFDKSLLQYAEYPPDANHGFEIESAVITVVSPTTYQLRTATLLLLLSTPDFSMPYNVIILTSTVMGLIFGTLFNLLVKKMLPVEEADKIQEDSSLKSRMKKLKTKIASRVERE
ncbi:related to GPI transamidase component GPI16 [Zygosaccharomyces bailii ISA1307]|nr:related to GPI transamidase component GPI16 [Zygosaccharomyces bailii ISA1307]